MSRELPHFGGVELPRPDALRSAQQELIILDGLLLALRVRHGPLRGWVRRQFGRWLPR